MFSTFVLLGSRSPVVRFGQKLAKMNPSSPRNRFDRTLTSFRGSTVEKNQNKKLQKIKKVRKNQTLNEYLILSVVVALLFSLFLAVPYFMFSL